MEPGIKTIAKRRPSVTLSEAAMERARMRHAWYRRQKEREARIAAKEAWNEGSS